MHLHLSLILLLFSVLTQAVFGQTSPIFSYEGRGLDSMGLEKFLYKNIIYPSALREDQTKAGFMVGMMFEVSSRGTIDSIYIYASSDSLATDEVKRVLKLSNGLWLPSRLEDGRPVKSKPFIIPIIYVIEGREGDGEVRQRFKDYFSTLPHLSEFSDCKINNRCIVYKPIEIATYEPQK